MPESTLCPTPGNALSDQRRHDPVSFWVQLGGDGDRFAQVEVVQERNKSEVYRLIRARPKSERVIGKRCRRRIARLEPCNYEKFLLTVHEPRMAQALQALR